MVDEAEPTNPAAEVLTLLGVGFDDRPRSGTRGDQTREAILHAAVALACRIGLGGLTMGTLATEVTMSKSGMFAHFGSKEALQLAVLDTAAREFAYEVVVPALAAPRGERRVRTLVDRWLQCGAQRHAGGCVFVKSSAELDDQPGPVRDRLRDQHLLMAASVARVFAGGIREGEFRSDADPQRFAADLHAVMLGYYHQLRLIEDPQAERRARAAVDALLDAVRQPISDKAVES